MLVSSILLLFTASYSRYLGLGLSAIWLGVALALRTEYLHGVLSNLWENTIHIGKTAHEWFSGLRPKDRYTLEHRLLAIMRQGDEEAQIFAIEALLTFNDRTILSQAFKYADKMPPQGKRHFLSLVEESPFYNDEIVLDYVDRWLHDDSDRQFTYYLKFFLAKQGLLHPEQVVEDLDSDDPQALGAAIVTLKCSHVIQNPLKSALNKTLAAQRLEELLDSHDQQQICVGLTVLGSEHIQSNVDLLIRYLNSSNMHIARTAAQSIAKIINRSSIRHASTLIKMLTHSRDKKFRLHCLEALGKIADSPIICSIINESLHFNATERRKVEEIAFRLGLRIVPTLISITKDPAVHYRCRILSGRILGSLALPQLHAHLYHIVHDEIARAWFYYYHYLNLSQEYPEHDLSLLSSSLQSGYHSVIDFIIQIMGAAGSLDNADMLSRSLRSTSRKVREQAVEALEKTFDRKIFRLLFPLISDLPRDEKLRHYRQEPLSLPQVLDRMDTSPSVADRIMAAMTRYQLNFPNWRDSVKKQMTTEGEIFHRFAYELLETGLA